MRVAVLTLLLAALTWADEIRLRNGDVLHGRIVERTDKYVVVEHPDLGKITIPSEKLAPLTPMEELAQREVAEEEKKIPKWNYSVSAGGVFTNDDDGEKANFNAALLINRKTPTRDTDFSARYIFALDNSITDKNNATVILTQKWLKEEARQYWFATTRYDFNEFRSWEHRLTGYLGAGYTWFKRETLKFDALAGLGGRKEWGSEKETLRAELLLGTIFRWTPSDGHGLSLGVTYYPTVGADPNQRIITTIDWRYLLDAKARLSLVTHLDWEFDTDPDPGFPSHNIRWTFGIQWDF